MDDPVLCPPVEFLQHRLRPSVSVNHFRGITQGPTFSIEITDPAEERILHDQRNLARDLGLSRNAQTSDRGRPAPITMDKEPGRCSVRAGLFMNQVAVDVMTNPLG